MKIFLTSSGLDTNRIRDLILNEVPKPVSNNKALMITYAQNEEELSHIQLSKEELFDTGIDHVATLNPGDFELIYVCGGNTFAIMKKMRELKLDEYIKKQVNKGSVYVGVSAGSIIAGPDISIAGWGSEGDKNEVGLEDLKGLNLVDVQVFPHYHTELKNEIEEFRKKYGGKVLELANGQAYVYLDGTEIFI